MKVFCKGLSIYPRVREKIYKGLSIYFDVHGRSSHSLECIIDKITIVAMFIDVGTRLLAYLSLRFGSVLLVITMGLVDFINCLG